MTGKQNRYETRKRLAQTFEYIRFRCAGGGHPPTLREILANTDAKSVSTVEADVVELAAQGFVKWDAGLNGTIRVIDSTHHETEDVKIALQMLHLTKHAN